MGVFAGVAVSALFFAGVFVIVTKGVAAFVGGVCVGYGVYVAQGVYVGYGVYVGSGVMVAAD